VVWGRGDITKRFAQRCCHTTFITDIPTLYFYTLSQPPQKPRTMNDLPLPEQAAGSLLVATANRREEEEGEGGRGGEDEV
jgi:hypothetical protein